MIAVLPDGVEIAVTDKMSVKRAKVYKAHAGLIDEMYRRLEESVGGDLQLDPPQLEEWIIKTFRQSLGVTLGPETDFFHAGVDSLKAIQMRGIIIRAIDLGSSENAKKCGAMVVSDCGNAKRLANFLYTLRIGQEENFNDGTTEMDTIIKELSVFDAHVPGVALSPKDCTVVSNPIFRSFLIKNP